MEKIIRKVLPTYRVTEKLGEGIYGSVFRIQDSFKERAVKVVPILVERSLSYRTTTEMDSKVSQDFHAVREYYEKIKGSGVIEIYDFHLVGKKISKEYAQAYLVILMEYCPDNLLNYVLDKFPLQPDRAYALMLDLAEVLRRLSLNTRETFLVTDLKPSNLLIDQQGNLVIGDLGGLKRLNSVSTSTNAQFSPNWSSPDFILNCARPGVASAVYSFGLVSYFIWEGHLPYENSDFIERIRAIKETGLDFRRTDIPRHILQVIRECTDFKPKSRPADFNEILSKIKTGSAPREPVAPPSRPPRSKQSIKKENELPAPVSPVRPKSKGQVAPATPPNKIWTEPITGMQFVWVPGGCFIIGSERDEPDALANEKPAHEVCVAGFWIGRYLVSQGEWFNVMGFNPSHFQKGERHPVEQVSWFDAQEFIRRMTAQTKGKYSFGLPTEAQWEYASRSGGRKEKFAGHHDPDAVAWYKDNSHYSTHPVGLKAPNGLGIFDMCGNVAEWCEDVYDEDAYRSRLKSSYSSSDEALHRVGRGGSWNTDARRCRTACRRGFPAGLGYTNLGFRLTRIP